VKDMRQFLVFPPEFTGVFWKCGLSVHYQGKLYILKAPFIHVDNNIKPLNSDQGVMAATATPQISSKVSKPMHFPHRQSRSPKYQLKSESKSFLRQSRY
jgi:hypothetical protein